MTKNNLLETLKGFTEETVKDLILPVQRQKEDKEPPMPRAPEVHIMGLADFTAAKKKAPYVFHQVITAKDWWTPGRSRSDSQATVRTVAAVYDLNNQEGQLAILELFERMRIALLEQGVIGGQFKLDYEAGVEYLIYPDNIPPFYAGEMVTVWKLPPVEREVKYGKQGDSNIKSGGPGAHSGRCPESGRHYGTKEQ